MRVATLREHELRGGRLIGLTPVSPTRPTFSDVQPTLNQRLHVASTGGRGSWRAVVFERPGRVDLAAWSRAVIAFVARHEAVRSELLVGLDSQISSRLHYDATVQVRREEHDLSGDAESRRHRLDAIIAEACRPSSWPASWFGVIERGDSSTFIAAFDRSLVDQVSLGVAMRDLHAMYGAELRPTQGSARLPVVGSHVDAAVEEEVAPFDPDSIEVSYWHDFLDRFDGCVPQSQFDTGLEPGQHALAVTSEHLLISPGQLSWLIASLGRRASAPTVVLAAAALAHRRAGSATGLTTLLQVDTRRLPEWEQAIGWFTTYVPLEIEAAATLRETLPRADLAWMLADSMGWVSVTRVLASAPGDVRWPHGDLNTVTWSDRRAIPGSDLVEVASATVLRQEAPADDFQLDFVRTREGVLVRCRRPDTQEAHESFDGWLKELRVVLDAGADIAVPRPRREVADQRTPR